jgi:hypothetical protein
MPNSGSLAAYPDVKEALDRALTSPRGVKATFLNHSDARRFQGRCNSFRKLDRRENLKIYPDPTHILHGRSPYDSLIIRLVELEVFMEVRTINLKMEDL